MTKATWGGESLVGFYFLISVHHQWKSRQELKEGRNLEAEADVEAMEEGSLLACSS